MTWSDEYREIVEFYFWEPQHLRRPDRPWPGAGTQADQMWEHVSGIEVATNHVLNLYLAMVPFSMLNDGWVPDEPYDIVPSEQLRLLISAQGEFTQPDLYFRAPQRDLAIELKTRSRSSLRQLQKYTCFQALLAPTTPLTLLYLTPWPDENIFEEGLPLTDVVARLPDLPLPLSRPGLPKAHTEVMRHLDVRTLSWAVFTDRVEELARTESHPVARRVHEGLVTWLRQRWAPQR